VAHAQGTPLVAFRSYAQGVLSLGPGDRVLSLPKLATAYGLGAGLIFPLLARAESILLGGQPHSKQVFELLFSTQPTVMFATPSLYSQFTADAEKDGAAHLFGSLRACISGAENMPARLAQRLKQILGVEILGGFGLTEAFHFVTATPPGESRPGSAGKLLDGFEVRIVDEEGKPVGPDEIGTLEIKGPTVTPNYWNRLDDSQITFRPDSWMRTADRFMVDREGYYFHCGRTDDLFKVGGKWVSPSEIERTLLAHESVWECAVIGVEDEEGLIKPAAFVVPNVGHAPGPELERALIQYVKKEIAPYKYPRWIQFVPSLPKGSHGKVLRYKLQFKRRPATSS
jgi:acyl-coenzyme A synthetase/AMP-(fatty) acid ligase